jgi:hypothetical protein
MRRAIIINFKKSKESSTGNIFNVFMTWKFISSTFILNNYENYSTTIALNFDKHVGEARGDLASVNRYSDWLWAG